MKKSKLEYYVVVDVETTGVTPKDNEVIEIGAVRLAYDGKTFKKRGEYQTLIKPYRSIPHTIQNLTKITPALVEKAPRFEDIYEEFIKFIGDAVFVAHNVQFDIQTININLNRVGGASITNYLIDSQQLVAIAYPMLSSHKLGDVARSLGIKRRQGHRALDDARVTAELFKKCLADMESLPAAVLIEINKLLQNHSWPLKDLLKKAEAKSCEGLSIEELSKGRGLAHVVSNMIEFKKRPASDSQRDEQIQLEELEKVMSAKGKLAKQFKNYEYREPQRKMLSLITSSFNDKEPVIIEAGTGTGKSLAYILPSVWWALQNNTPVVISTRTKNLQSQLIDKDLPIITKVLGQQVNALVLKGRENYVCLRRLELLFKKVLLGGSLDQVINLMPLLIWLSKSETGDLSELHPLLHRFFFQSIRSEATACLGSKCALHGCCFLENIRKQARRADVLIVNHALLCADLSGEGYLLPEYNQVVIDEGHALEDAATESFAITLSVSTISEELKRLQSISDAAVVEMVSDLRGKTFSLFELLFQFVTANKKLVYNEEMQLILTPEMEGRTGWPELMAAVKLWQEACAKLERAIEKIELDDDELQSEIASAAMTLQKYSNQFAFVFDLKEHEFVHWITAASAMPPYNCFLKAAPIAAGSFLQEHLFEKKDSVVITSATLTVGGEFSYFLERMGFDPKLSGQYCHALGSSFDYEKQLLFCVPSDFPASDEENFSSRTRDLFLPLFETTKGRALVLFTSYSMLQKVYNKVRIDLEKKGITILCQGKHGSRRAILNRFKDNEKAVLFGTDSFWEGVDVPGAALSCVVMMKLPFSVPTEPVTAARVARYAAQGKDGFFSYSIPQAVMKFKQGLGRLIRTKDDKGVVILMDNRVLTKNYGKIFLKSIPGGAPQVMPAKDIVSSTEKWLK